MGWCQLFCWVLLPATFGLIYWAYKNPKYFRWPNLEDNSPSIDDLIKEAERRAAEYDYNLEFPTDYRDPNWKPAWQQREMIQEMRFAKKEEILEQLVVIQNAADEKEERFWEHQIYLHSNRENIRFFAVWIAIQALLVYFFYKYVIETCLRYFGIHCCDREGQEADDTENSRSQHTGAEVEPDPWDASWFGTFRRYAPYFGTGVNLNYPLAIMPPPQPELPESGDESETIELNVPPVQPVHVPSDSGSQDIETLISLAQGRGNRSNDAAPVPRSPAASSPSRAPVPHRSRPVPASPADSDSDDDMPGLVDAGVTCAACGRVGTDDANVRGHLWKCVGCKSVHYCNPKCQESHWKVHKKQCKRLRKGKKKQNPKPELVDEVD